MPDALRDQMFNEGDWVRVIGPLAELYGSSIGVVRSASPAGVIFRYVVEFEDGRGDTFFGFELRHANKQSAIA